MIEIRDLVVTYGRATALDEVSLTVGKKCITAVLGANGAGKTTLLRCIHGLVSPRAGRVVLEGVDITGLPPEHIVRLGLAHVPERRGVIAQLSVQDNLLLGGLWRGFRERRAHTAAGFDQVFDLFPPLAQRRRHLAETLSGGERQMLAIGRALMARPRVLLLDEPSLGLAPQVVAQIFAVLRELSQLQGITVLLVEQNAHSALSIADRGVVLNLGRVVVTGAASRLATAAELRHVYLGF
ncbi:ABC transporter ATP-binding protein [Streptomyces sp. NPDC051776]|uniref:ABC transporter ATP-binding protein n=1 Tax=Streptomyces sp. NPDC051776 TaxID=3155414 RepID=UPI003421AC83